jgi:L-threonylcarbamoyladenylate synthase
MTIEEAAAIIQDGGVVAFPTETVYGLGANALDRSAIRRVYELKKRPATSPLIVHVDSLEMAQALAADWPVVAEGLARRYWPGPLTIVVRKSPSIPDEVTAGLDTVGLRMPSHSLALELIRACGVPLAAPSANPFSRLSPTTAAHVREAFGDQVPVLDGGPTQVGIESTVVSVVDGGITLLRPGMITIPGVTAAPALAIVGGQAHASPGLHHKHYSPLTPVVLLDPGEDVPAGAAYIWYRTAKPASRAIEMPDDPVRYAAAIYGVLHELDALGFPAIAIERVPDEERWSAIADRLKRAASRD